MAINTNGMQADNRCNTERTQMRTPVKMKSHNRNSDEENNNIKSTAAATKSRKSKSPIWSHGGLSPRNAKLRY